MTPPKLAAFLYVLGILLMPFAMTSMLRSLHLFHPTLVLGALVFLLLGAPMRDKRALTVVVYAFLSASVGYFFIAVSQDRENPSSLYTVYIEPIRLCLYVIWFWVSIEFLRTKRSFVFRWLAISAALQLGIAIYLYLALYNLVPVPDVVAVYLSLFKMRQSVWIGDTPVPRMAGTFAEGPPFGLFMFSCFVIFAIFLTERRKIGMPGCLEMKWAIFGGTVTLVGAVASLSDQIFLAVIVFGLFLYHRLNENSTERTRARRFAEVALATLLLVGMAVYVLPNVVTKATQAADTKAGELDTRADAGRERMFHIRYGLGLLGENPLAIFTGIGPGRYGDYVVRTGQYRADVPTQIMPIAWLVEYGALGTLLIVNWLWNITNRAQQKHSSLAIGGCAALVLANITQGFWMSDAWFLALAFFYCAGSEKTPKLATPSRTL